MTELINLIERNIDDDNYDDLDWLSQSLAEFNYYHNTNKWVKEKLLVLYS